MATYNKRGYKAPKPKEVKEEVSEFEEVTADGSTTAEVFDTLDEKANKIEDWVTRNQKYILGTLATIVVLTVSYLLYQKFIVAPKEEEAFNDMFQAQQYFEQAVNNTTSPDSLYKLSLKGGEGKLGFTGVIEQYSGTKAANLAQYYAGMAYLNTKDFKKALEHLQEFSSDDVMLKTLSIGAIGDAYAELNQKDKALDQYKKAAADENDFTTPRFLYKAAVLALELKKNGEALEMFKKLDEKFETSPEAQSAKAYVSMLEK